MCLQAARSSSEVFDYPTDRWCGCCRWTLPGSDGDARTNFTCFLRRGICCLKLLGSGCQLSTNSTRKDMHEEQKMIKVPSLTHDAMKDNNEYDRKSLDSGLYVSQESNIGSGTELMVANPRRMDVMRSVRLEPAALTFVCKSVPSIDIETGNVSPGKSGDRDVYQKKQAVVTETDVLMETQKHVKSPGHEYRSRSPKPNRKHPQDDLGVDSTEEKIPADKSNANASPDFKDNSMSGRSSEGGTKALRYRDSKDGLRTWSDLCTTRKQSTEDEELLMDDVIHLRRDSVSVPPDVGDDNATAAKQLVVTTATVTNRLVVTDNGTMTPRVTIHSCMSVHRSFLAQLEMRRYSVQVNISK